MNRAVFLDRDGTLIEDRGHLRDPAEVVFFPDTMDALSRLGEFLLFIVTHQPGVARGLLTEADVRRVNDHTVAALAASGITIRDIYVCPHGREDGCSCIKPRPYFLRAAARDYDLDLERSFVVGDHPHDVELAHGVGATGLYVLTGHGAKHLSELGTESAVVVSGIAEAARYILEGR